MVACKLVPCLLLLLLCCAIGLLVSCSATRLAAPAALSLPHQDRSDDARMTMSCGDYIFLPFAAFCLCLCQYSWAGEMMKTLPEMTRRMSPDRNGGSPTPCCLCFARALAAARAARAPYITAGDICGDAHQLVWPYLLVLRRKTVTMGFFWFTTSR